MKKIRRKMLLITLALSMIIPNILSVSSNVIVAEAASIKTTEKKLTLNVGESRTLSVAGAKKKITWKSSKKSVATVTSKGKVTAKAQGAVTITASVDGKKFSYKITVKAVPNKYLKDAPYNAVEKKIGDISLVIPKDYEYDLNKISENEYSINLIPPESTQDSSIAIYVYKTGLKAEKYKILKEQYSAIMTLEMAQSLLEDNYYPADIKINKFTNSDYEANLGYAFRTECAYTVDGHDIPVEQIIYGLVFDNYNTTVNMTDREELDLDTVAQYILNSIIVTK